MSPEEIARLLRGMSLEEVAQLLRRVLIEVHGNDHGLQKFAEILHRLMAAGMEGVDVKPAAFDFLYTPSTRN